MKTTGELRAALADAFVKARAGELSGDAMRGMIGAANQINTSLAIELKAQNMTARVGGTPTQLGMMRITGK